MAEPLIIAHRGASFEAPENTLASIKRAIEIGADGVEFDVRLAKDGVVMFHDPNLKRTAGRKEKVRDLTVQELSQIDCGSWFNTAFPERANEEFAKERIATLEQVLEILADFKGEIYIELKCKPRSAETLVTLVSDAIINSPLLPYIIVKSFDHNVLPLMKKQSEDIHCAGLYGKNILEILRKKSRIAKISAEHGAEYLSIHRGLVGRKIMRAAEKHGLKIAVWTQDDEKVIPKYKELGIHAIITNDPRKMLSQLSSE